MKIFRKKKDFGGKWWRICGKEKKKKELVFLFKWSRRAVGMYLVKRGGFLGTVGGFVAK